MAIKTYALEELEDKFIGEIGTPARDKYDAYIYCFRDTTNIGYGGDR